MPSQLEWKIEREDLKRRNARLFPLFENRNIQPAGSTAFAMPPPICLWV
jgi:hypothetical protein